MKNRILLASLLVILYSGCQKEAAPVGLTSFSPSAGDYNSSVVITGSNFGSIGNTTVKLGLIDAKVESVSPNQIVATILPGTASDKITVTSNGQAITSEATFNVTAGTWEPGAYIYDQATSQTAVSFSIGSMGFTHVSSGKFGTAKLEVFNDPGNAYGQRKPLSAGFVSNGATAFGTNTKGYILQAQTLWEYDPASDNWTAKGSLPAFMIGAEVLCGCYIQSTGNAVLVDAKGNFITYHPLDDTWTKDDNPVPFAFFISNSETQICRSTEGKAYFKNAFNIWEWTASSNTWALLPEFPNRLTPNYGFTNGDDVYMGVSDKDFLWVYKPDVNVWVQKAGIAIRLRQDPVSFTANRKGYFGFGYNSLTESYMGDLYEYVPGN